MNLKCYLTLLAIVLLAAFDTNAQGCVAIRSFSGCGSVSGSSAFLGKGEFLLGTNARYFKSFRHYKGTVEQLERLENNTEVINKSTFLDFTVNYGITNRLYANATIPFVFHNRTSLYEHGGNTFGYRGETIASGLSDVRLGLGYWLFNPSKVENFNYALGLGVKLNTGKYDVKDTFHNQGPEKNEDRVQVVDQSIQPGDGGISLATDLQGYHIISDRFSITSTFYYLFGIAESNGVLTRNQPEGGTEFAVPDQYLARLGLSYATPLKGLSVYGGGRMEGVPAEDLIGGSNAYRRPGYSIALEPGVTYTASNLSVNLSVPFAVERNRTRSYLDKTTSVPGETPKHGDAAFADYLVNFGITYRLNHKSHSSLSDMEEMKN